MESLKKQKWRERFYKKVRFERVLFYVGAFSVRNVKECREMSSLSFPVKKLQNPMCSSSHSHHSLGGGEEGKAISHSDGD